MKDKVEIIKRLSEELSRLKDLFAELGNGGFAVASLPGAMMIIFDPMAADQLEEAGVEVYRYISPQYLDINDINLKA